MAEATNAELESMLKAWLTKCYPDLLEIELTPEQVKELISDLWSQPDSFASEYREWPDPEAELSPHQNVTIYPSPRVTINGLYITAAVGRLLTKAIEITPQFISMLTVDHIFAAIVLTRFNGDMDEAKKHFEWMRSTPRQLRSDGKRHQQEDSPRPPTLSS